MATLTIEYPAELSVALGKRPEDAAREVRLMAALKLFESGRVSSGLAAKLAGMSRVAFLCQCGQYGVSVFQQDPDELASDVQAALHARRG
jgi:predicted HTH domain antitoxin